MAHMVLVVFGSAAAIYFATAASTNLSQLSLGVSLFICVNAVWIAARLYVQLKLQVDSMHKKLGETNEMLFVDLLTGIYNRRYLEQELNEAWAVAERNATDLSFILIDVDDFKRLNDEAHDHGVGDMVLRELAKFLLTKRRRGDVLGRYGGDELAFITPTSVAGARAFAERLRYAIENEFKPFPVERISQITCSFGVATKGYGVETRMDLVNGADTSLYRAKEQGKNCVAFHGSSAVTSPILTIPVSQ
jgi:diguanylate cyclase (GGDEF)-like protein